PAAAAHFTPSVWLESAVRTWLFDPTGSRATASAPEAAIRSPFASAIVGSSAVRGTQWPAPESQLTICSSPGDGATTSPTSSKWATVADGVVHPPAPFRKWLLFPSVFTFT